MTSYVSVTPNEKRPEAASQRIAPIPGAAMRTTPSQLPPDVACTCSPPCSTAKPTDEPSCTWKTNLRRQPPAGDSNGKANWPPAASSSDLQRHLQPDSICACLRRRAERRQASN
eukprot:6985061-Prymnesium_polylepis.1